MRTEKSDKELLEWLRQQGLGPIPEYVHFLEPDGTISSKKFLDLLPGDWQRLIDQYPIAFEKWRRGEITQAEFDLLVSNEEGHA